jgi:hypothetical protein
MNIYIVGFDPVDNPNGGVGGFNWFYLKENALSQFIEHTADDDNYFVWFRKLEVADEINLEAITEHIQNLIRDFGSDGDWVPVKEND